MIINVLCLLFACYSLYLFREKKKSEKEISEYKLENRDMIEENRNLRRRIDHAKKYLEEQER